MMHQNCRRNVFDYLKELPVLKLEKLDPLEVERLSPFKEKFSRDSALSSSDVNHQENSDDETILCDADYMNDLNTSDENGHNSEIVSMEEGVLESDADISRDVLYINDASDDVIFVGNWFESSADGVEITKLGNKNQAELETSSETEQDVDGSVKVSANEDEHDWCRGTKRKKRGRPPKSKRRCTSVRTNPAEMVLPDKSDSNNANKRSEGSLITKTDAPSEISQILESTDAGEISAETDPSLGNDGVPLRMSASITNRGVRQPEEFPTCHVTRSVSRQRRASSEELCSTLSLANEIALELPKKNQSPKTSRKSTSEKSSMDKWTKMSSKNAPQTKTSPGTTGQKSPKKACQNKKLPVERSTLNQGISVSTAKKRKPTLSKVVSNVLSFYPDSGNSATVNKNPKAKTRSPKSKCGSSITNASPKSSSSKDNTSPRSKGAATPSKSTSPKTCAKKGNELPKTKASPTKSKTTSLKNKAKSPKPKVSSITTKNTSPKGKGSLASNNKKLPSIASPSKGIINVPRSSRLLSCSSSYSYDSSDNRLEIAYVSDTVSETDSSAAKTKSRKKGANNIASPSKKKSPKRLSQPNAVLSKAQKKSPSPQKKKSPAKNSRVLPPIGGKRLSNTFQIAKKSLENAKKVTNGKSKTPTRFRGAGGGKWLNIAGLLNQKKNVKRVEGQIGEKRIVEGVTFRVLSGSSVPPPKLEKVLSKCFYCNHAPFTKKLQLQRHLEQEHKFRCSRCKTTFPSKVEKEQHQLIHVKEFHTCVSCGETYRTMFGIKQHWSSRMHRIVEGIFQRFVNLLSPIVPQVEEAVAGSDGPVAGQLLWRKQGQTERLHDNVEIAHEESPNHQEQDAESEVLTLGMAAPELWRVGEGALDFLGHQRSLKKHLDKNNLWSLLDDHENHCYYESPTWIRLKNIINQRTKSQRQDGPSSGESSEPSSISEDHATSNCQTSSGNGEVDGGTLEEILESIQAMVAREGWMDNENNPVPSHSVALSAENGLPGSLPATTNTGGTRNSEGPVNALSNSFLSQILSPDAPNHNPGPVATDQNTAAANNLLSMPLDFDYFNLIDEIDPQNNVSTKQACSNEMSSGVTSSNSDVVMESQNGPSTSSESFGFSGAPAATVTSVNGQDNVKDTSSCESSNDTHERHIAASVTTKVCDSVDNAEEVVSDVVSSNESSATAVKTTAGSEESRDNVPSSNDPGYAETTETISKSNDDISGAHNSATISAQCFYGTNMSSGAETVNDVSACLDDQNDTLTMSSESSISTNESSISTNESSISTNESTISTNETTDATGHEIDKSDMKNTSNSSEGTEKEDSVSWRKIQVRQVSCPSLHSAGTKDDHLDDVERDASDKYRASSTRSKEDADHTLDEAFGADRVPDAIIQPETDDAHDASLESGKIGEDDSRPSVGDDRPPGDETPSCSVDLNRNKLQANFINQTSAITLHTTTAYKSVPFFKNDNRNSATVVASASSATVTKSTYVWSAPASTEIQLSVCTASHQRPSSPTYQVISSGVPTTISNCRTGAPTVQRPEQTSVSLNEAIFSTSVSCEAKKAPDASTEPNDVSTRPAEKEARQTSPVALDHVMFAATNVRTGSSHTSAQPRYTVCQASAVFTVVPSTYSTCASSAANESVNANKGWSKARNTKSNTNEVNKVENVASRKPSSKAGRGASDQQSQFRNDGLQNDANSGEAELMSDAEFEKFRDCIEEFLLESSSASSAPNSPAQVRAHINAHINEQKERTEMSHPNVMCSSSPAVECYSFKRLTSAQEVRDHSYAHVHEMFHGDMGAISPIPHLSDANDCDMADVEDDIESEEKENDSPNVNLERNPSGLQSERDLNLFRNDEVMSSNLRARDSPLDLTVPKKPIRSLREMVLSHCNQLSSHQQDEEALIKPNNQVDVIDNNGNESEMENDDGETANKTKNDGGHISNVQLNESLDDGCDLVCCSYELDETDTADSYEFSDDELKNCQQNHTDRVSSAQLSQARWEQAGVPGITTTVAHSENHNHWENNYEKVKIPMVADKMQKCKAKTASKKPTMPVKPSPVSLLSLRMANRPDVADYVGGESNELSTSRTEQSRPPWFRPMAPPIRKRTLLPIPPFLPTPPEPRNQFLSFNNENHGASNSESCDSDYNYLTRMYHHYGFPQANREPTNVPWKRPPMDLRPPARFNMRLPQQGFPRPYIGRMRSPFTQSVRNPHHMQERRPPWYFPPSQYCNYY